MSLFDSVSSTVSAALSSALPASPFSSGGFILSSDWTGLNPKLLAKFYPLKLGADGGWTQSMDTRKVSDASDFTVFDGVEVWCPITDAQSEMTFNWHSPFEGAGAESKAPTLSAMLQSGSLNAGVQAVGEKIGGSAATDAASSALSSAQGRAGITKLNSTQVFQGMPPVKLSLTAHFRAIVDPQKEVRDPISMLKQWAVPQYLAPDSVIANAIKNGASEPGIETLFPSMVPQIIGMRYGDMTWAPLVIESISEPISGPRDVNGVLISSSVTLSLATLTAIDRQDIQRIYA
jgi:hypothetical protein